MSVSCTYFSSLLVLTDKMAFTCRHVLILDRGRRLAALYTVAVAPDFFVASSRALRRVSFFIIHVKTVRFYAPAALTLHFIYSDSSASRTFCIPFVEYTS